MQQAMIQLVPCHRCGGIPDKLMIGIPDETESYLQWVCAGCLSHAELDELAVNQREMRLQQKKPSNIRLVEEPSDVFFT